MEANWDDLRTVHHLVETGSLAGAATELGINYTTVARRISRIEADLGQQLFVRSPDRYVPTDAGRIVAQAGAEMSMHTGDMLRSLKAADETLSGELTLTAPQLLVAKHLAPVLAQFSEAYPTVTLNTLATNNILDLARPQADLAIRISNSPDDTLVGQKLARQSSLIYATPDLAERVLANPKDEVNWIGMTHWTQPPKATLSTCPNWRIGYRFDDMVAVIGAATAGLGLVRLAKFLGDGTEGLVRVNIMEPQDYWDIWVLTHPDLRASPKVAAFKSLLIPFFKSNASDFYEPPFTSANSSR